MRPSQEPTRTRQVAAGLALACVGTWLLQSAPTLTAPPTGAHAWRETDGLIVARNYCVEQAPFLEPRVSYRGATDGRTGLEFPILNYISGRVGCATGDFVTPWRVMSLLSGCLLGLCLWAAARACFGSLAASCAVICFATSPLVPYFSRTTQPDITAAALATAAVAVAARAKTWGAAALAFALVCGAALLKLPAAVYLLPTLLFAVPHGPTLGRTLGLLAMSGSSALAALSWYSYAHRLQLLNGIATFALDRSPAQLWSEWHTRNFWFRNFLQLPFDEWVFPLATVFLLVALAWRRRRTPWRVAVLGATVLACIFLCGNSGAVHDYYGVMLLPALAWMMGWAVAELLSLQWRALQVGLAVLVVAAVGWQVYRIRGYWPTHESEWAELSAFSHREMGPQGASHIVVFSDGSPEAFWFTGQIGRFGEAAQPAPGPRDSYTVVDRLRLRKAAASVEATLAGRDCARVFENTVAWVCRTRPQ